MATPVLNEPFGDTNKDGIPRLVPSDLRIIGDSYICNTPPTYWLLAQHIHMYN